MDVLERIEKLVEDAAGEIASSESLQKLEGLRIRYLGRKSGLTTILKGLGSLPADLRPEVGKRSNRAKMQIEGMLQERNRELADEIFSSLAEDEFVDITEPGRSHAVGHLHPITQMRFELEDIFTSMGFTIQTGPEVET
jgi:phenylalanyl-tRNA synthetase alpha chain